jgi:hypothetical protein
VFRDIWEQEWQQRLSERARAEGATRTMQDAGTHRDNRNLTFVQFIESRKSSQRRKSPAVQQEETPVCVNFHMEVEGNCKNIRQRDSQMDRNKNRKPLQGSTLTANAFSHKKHQSEEIGPANPESDSKMTPLQQLQVLDIALSSQNCCNYLKNSGQAQTLFKIEADCPLTQPGLNIRSLRNEEVVECFNFTQSADRTRNRQRLMQHLNKAGQREGRGERRGRGRGRGQKSSYVNDIAGWAVGNEEGEVEFGR